MANLSNPASVLAPWTAALASALALGTLLPQPVAAQSPPTKRAITPEKVTPAKALDNGKYYALVIGINTYPTPLPTLKTAENDAQAIASTLRTDYGFDVKLLLGHNATRNSILDAVNRYEGALQPNDNLLIYYAGHGYESKTTGKAYWLPSDADSTSSPNRIIADDITSEMAAIPARHILVISDSCYSGGLTREAPTTPHAGIQNDAFLKRMLSSRSRTLMASGGDEPVSDAGRDNHSIFAYALLQALNAEAEAMFSASDLFYTGVRQRVAGSSTQLPQYAIIRNSTHDDGDFVFTRRSGAASGLTDTSTIASATRSASGPPSTIDFDRANALYLAEDFEHAFPLMKAACDANDLRGCGPEGYMYARGKGVEGDPGRGAALARRGCDGGDAHSCSILGGLYETGTGVALDMVQAVALYRQGCDGGYAIGCSNLGFMYENGTGVTTDIVQATALYRRACNGDDASGCANLGYMYETGTGVGVDKAQAAAFYRKGCDGGYAKGCSNLGVMYEHGYGVTRDKAQAVVFYRKSCDGSDATGCTDLGYMYESGSGVGQDKVQAVALYRKGCDGGDARGCSNLAYMYSKGSGVTQDQARAVALYRKGCDGSDLRGCTDLGYMYESGTGVGQDKVQAVALYRKSCDGGNAQGCSYLGDMYEHGTGVTQDKIQAITLYKKGCDGGNDFGCTNLKRLQP